MHATQEWIRLNQLEWALSEGLDYFNAYEIIKKSNAGLLGKQPTVRNGHIPILALAIEVILKALHYGVAEYNSASIKPIKQHDIEKLFNGLPPDIKNKILHEFQKYYPDQAYPYKSMFGNNFESMLRRHKNAFIDWRYGYEPKTVQFHFQFCEALAHSMIEVANQEIKALNIIVREQIAKGILPVLRMDRAGQKPSPSSHT